ncbi:hypothetical protein B0H21DRAFT_825644 [Amylocystis lapponica]|nr:hypothetical protein B0H21DRAFT_825644 [Amylocystis lapponica]
MGHNADIALTSIPSRSRAGTSCRSHLSAHTIHLPLSSPLVTYHSLNADIHARSLSSDRTSTWIARQPPVFTLQVGARIRLADREGIVSPVQGVVAGVRSWERFWVEFWVKGTQSDNAYLCVPAHWASLGPVRRSWHALASRWLIDSLPPPPDDLSAYAISWPTRRAARPPPGAPRPSSEFIQWPEEEGPSAEELEDILSSFSSISAESFISFY